MERLGINYGLLIAQIVNVALLVWILSMLLYKPLINLLNERTKRIEEGLKESANVKAQMVDMRKDADVELAKARQEAAAILAQAQDRAKVQEAELIAQARREADRIREEARGQLEREREVMVRDLRGQMATLVTITASKVLNAELKGNHDKLIDESLASLVTVR